MSYIVAWKYQNRLFCVADSALTRPGPPHDQLSSFGELQAQIADGRIVEESTVKIVPLSNAVAVAFVGNLEFANQYIAQLHRRVDEPIGDVLLEIASHLPIPQGSSLGLALLNFQNPDRPQLLRWVSQEPSAVGEVDAWLSMGSLVGTPFADIVEGFLSQLAANNMDAQHLLVTITGVLQWLGVHNPLMTYGVGGAVFGAKIDDHGFSWQPDITYVIYPPTIVETAIVGPPGGPLPMNLEPQHSTELVTCVVRDNVWVASSTVTGAPKYMAHLESLPFSIQEWGQRWDNALRLYFDSLASEFFIWIAKREGTLIVTKTQGGVPDNKYFAITRVREHEYRFCLAAEFVTALLTPPSVTPAFNEKAIRFMFLTAHPRDRVPAGGITSG